MTNFDITKYNKTELQEIAKILKKFRALRKNIGKKSSQILSYELSWDHKLIVEYFPALDKTKVLDTTKNIYKNIFGIDINETKLVWKENTNLKWWMRLFFWDDLLDISFESVSNSLRKI